MDYYQNLKKMERIETSYMFICVNPRLSAKSAVKPCLDHLKFRFSYLFRISSFAFRISSPIGILQNEPIFKNTEIYLNTYEYKTYDKLLVTSH